MRHSRAATADVVVRVARGAELQVEVRDEGPAATAPMPGAGTGVAGMRSRTAELGGRLEAGPVGDGFVVRAAVPIGHQQ